MKNIIADIAKKIGIDVIGFTDVVDYSYLQELLVSRKNNGLNSEFEEQNIKKRLDARNILPGCKSIIAIAVPYAEGYKKSQAPNKGLLSVVSYKEDYHRNVKKLLESLAFEMKNFFSFEYAACVDTTPLVDREICKNAGIGHYGKNSLLINENFGSFINLGYLLTDLEIKCVNSQSVDICNDCTICIKSCPNSAILKGGTIDATRCISGLTQTKKYIPLDYRKNMKNQIYGCDVCQLLCPKNKKILEKKTNEDYKILELNLEELLKISNAEFEQKYSSMSGSWRGKNVWKRNALISIANLKLVSLFEDVENELDNPSDMIKTYAYWALMELDSKKASDILNKRYDYENDIIKCEILKLLEVYHDSGNM
ncbi:MAG: tRNA epoxyqueuosine(34) reductase QueG [Sedimentibacter saalensis]|jgi:epoxyqueuosine reductase|uniref:tRNA epoxyqueuosine(34) reductase QueG n=1 Tax=Sedimentibacter saalensis TaxID=130788 RepID=UPI002B206744|nr:tRNA epoxyqueuosine(34) reductase QueG [Sedimentibacter saalensis]MEA5096568.1 tRNA epoxyqueuosine(34) reductase QueG [Sedimentibacter saalensis]